MSDYLDLLHPAQREILQELARDFDEEPSESELVQAVLSSLVSGDLQRRIHANANPRSSAYPGSFSVANSKSSRTKKPRGKKSKSKPSKKQKLVLSPLERERFSELEDEIKKGQQEQNSRRLPAVPSKDEILHLLSTVRQAAKDGKRLGKRDYLLLRLFYATGCRRSEIEGMIVGDLRLDTQRIFIRDGKEWASYCTSSFSG